MTRVTEKRSAEKRLDYVARISQYQANQIVFVDESSVDRKTFYCGHAYTIQGRAERKAFFVRGKG